MFDEPKIVHVFISLLNMVEPDLTVHVTTCSGTLIMAINYRR